MDGLAAAEEEVGERLKAHGGRTGWAEGGGLDALCCPGSQWPCWGRQDCEKASLRLTWNMLGGRH